MNRYRNRTDFSLKNGRIRAEISISLEATLEEGDIGKAHYNEAISREIEKAIMDGITKAYDALYRRMGVDGFNLARMLERHNTALYEMDKDIMETVLVFDINVNLRSTGAVV